MGSELYPSLSKTITNEAGGKTLKILPKGPKDYSDKLSLDITFESVRVNGSTPPILKRRNSGWIGVIFCVIPSSVVPCL
jgi:hypothetical protein